MPTDNNTAQILAGINAILAQIAPLMGIGFATAYAIRDLLKQNGVPIDTFAAEIAKYEEAQTRLADAIAEFKVKFGDM